jgi:hypothetical protein
MSLLGVRYANTFYLSDQSLTKSDGTFNYYRNQFPSRDCSPKSPSIPRQQRTRATSRQQTRCWRRSYTTRTSLVSYMKYLVESNCANQQEYHDACPA